MPTQAEVVMHHRTIAHYERVETALLRIANALEVVAAGMVPASAYEKHAQPVHSTEES